MSYILDAIKKVEHEQNLAQSIKKSSKDNKWLAFFHSSFWFWCMLLLIVNVISLSVLLWQKNPVTSPQIYIVTPHESIQLNSLSQKLSQLYMHY